MPFLRWSCEHALQQIHEALAGILDNLPNRAAAWGLRPLMFPFGARRRPPRDALGAHIARALLENREERLHLTSDIYIPPPHEPGLGRLEAALDKAVAALAVEAKVRDAVRARRIDRAPGDALLDLAMQASVITPEERQLVREADEARDEVIQVDAFDTEEYRRLRRPPAQILGQLMNAIFLDVMDEDVLRLQRSNFLLADMPPAQRQGYRVVDLVVLRPSQDLGKLVRMYEPRLPRGFRFLTRGLDTRETSSPDVLSLLMFQPDYLARLIEIGEGDAEARLSEIAALVEVHSAKSSPVPSGRAPDGP